MLVSDLVTCTVALHGANFSFVSLRILMACLFSNTLGMLNEQVEYVSTLASLFTSLVTWNYVLK